MKIHCPEQLAPGWVVIQNPAPTWKATFIVKATLRMVHGGVPELVEEADPVRGDVYENDVLGGEIAYPSDLAPFKPRGDVVVRATAHAPNERQTTRLTVSIKVGGLEKSLAVWGDRRWRPKMIRADSLDPPRPFLEMPVRYALAHGVAGTAHNPVGLGRKAGKLPNIEYPLDHDSHVRGLDLPAGFGALAPSWEPRCAMLGSYKRSYWKTHWPWFPENFDWGHFNAAPIDQQIQGYLRGNEALRFVNLHAQHAVYQTRLPGIRARLGIERHESSSIEDVPMVLDSLNVNLETERLMLVWRGQCEVDGPKLRDIADLYVYAEPLDENASIDEIVATIHAREGDQDDEDDENNDDAPREDAASESPGSDVDPELDEPLIDSTVADIEAFQQQYWNRHRPPGLPVSADAPAPSTIAQSAAALLAARRAMPPAPDGASLATEDEVAEGLAEAAVDEEAAAEPDATSSETSDADATGDGLTRADVAARLQRGEPLSSLVLDGLDLTDLDFSGIDLTTTSLVGANLAAARMVRANLTHADLGEADLTSADLSHATLDHANISDATLTDTTLIGASLSYVDFATRDLAGLDLSDASGFGTDFSECNLRGASLKNVKFTQADFCGACLDEVDASGASLPSCQMEALSATGIVLDDADLTELHASDASDFTGAKMRRVKGPGSIWSQSKLDEVDFTGAVLPGALFDESSLVNARLHHVDLTRANLDDAILTRASLKHCNCLYCTFERADLQGAHIVSSNLFECGFWQAKFDETVIDDSNIKGTLLEM